MAVKLATLSRSRGKGLQHNGLVEGWEREEGAKDPQNAHTLFIHVMNFELVGNKHKEGSGVERGQVFWSTLPFLTATSYLEVRPHEGREWKAVDVGWQRELSLCFDFWRGNFCDLIRLGMVVACKRGKRVLALTGDII